MAGEVNRLLVLVLAAGAVAASQAPVLRSGIDLSTLDRIVRPQDDLYRYANGAWLFRTDMPADRVSFGAFQEVGLIVERDLDRLIREIAARRDRSAVERQIADLYDSMVDEKRIEAAGITPALRQLTRIASISSRSDIAREAGLLSAAGNGGLFDAEVGGDPQQPGVLAVRVRQGGLLLPYAAYYLDADPGFREVRAAYEAYLKTLFTLAGRTDAAADARLLLAFETALAAAHDPAGVESRVQLRQLADTMPGFDWHAWAIPQGIDRAGVLVLGHPPFFKTFAATIAATPIETLKLWLTARYLTAVAPYLDQSFGRARFELFGRLLTGQQVQIERWRRGVSLVNTYLGDAIGRRYVEKHFPPASKRRAQDIVETIVRAYRDAIATSEWLSAGAKTEAERKLDRLTVRIGYPDSWRNYSRLDIRHGDLLGNVDRGRAHDTAFRQSFGSGQADPRYWLFPPQTVNASYAAAANELVVPAAILQPPFFDARAEDAVNYGAIGAIVAHEIGHALDDRGRFYDANGRVRDWWQPADLTQYATRTAALVDQFGRYEPAEGARVDGRRTLTENANDLSGLAIANAAYHASLGGRAAPVIDGLTANQRFFIAWARVWRSKERDDYLRQWVVTLPHSPPEYRVNGIVRHMPAFYNAFNVSAGDLLYQEPAQRLRIW